MNKIILIFISLFIFLFTSCAGNFNIQGKWTGSSGYIVTTMNFKKNGTCTIDMGFIRLSESKYEILDEYITFTIDEENKYKYLIEKEDNDNIILYLLDENDEKDDDKVNSVLKLSRE